MIDIIKVDEDIVLFDTQTEKAKNILSVQLGALEYAPEMGVDLRYFLSENFIFQNESFRSYLIQILANNSINVASVVDTVDDLFTQYTFNLSPSEDDSGMVAG